MILSFINLFFSIAILLRDPLSGKNTLDMIMILFRYMKKKNIGILKKKRMDLFSKNQMDVLQNTKEKNENK